MARLPFRFSVVCRRTAAAERGSDVSAMLPKAARRSVRRTAAGGTADKTNMATDDLLFATSQRISPNSAVQQVCTANHWKRVFCLLSSCQGVCPHPERPSANAAIREPSETRKDRATALRETAGQRSPVRAWRVSQVRGGLPTPTDSISRTAAERQAVVPTGACSSAINRSTNHPAVRTAAAS